MTKKASYYSITTTALVIAFIFSVPPVQGRDITTSSDVEVSARADGDFTGAQKGTTQVETRAKTPMKTPRESEVFNSIPFVREGDKAAPKKDDKRPETVEEHEATRTIISERREFLKTQIETGRASVETRVEARKEALTEHRAEVRIRLEAQAKSRVEAAIQRIISRFTTQVGHLESLETRIESRVTSLTEEGLDTSLSIELLAEASAKIELAKEDIVEIEALLEVEADTETSKKQIRALTETALASINEARQALLDVVRSLKDVVRTRTEIKTEVGTETEAEVQ